MARTVLEGSFSPIPANTANTALLGNSAAHFFSEIGVVFYNPL